MVLTTGSRGTTDFVVNQQLVTILRFQATCDGKLFLGTRMLKRAQELMHATVLLRSKGFSAHGGRCFKLPQLSLLSLRICQIRCWKLFVKGKNFAKFSEADNSVR